jgi:two-component system response regulator HydG
MARILVVDDEQEVCDMLKKFLIKRGHKVYTALNGEEALSIVKEERPHIVLLDIRMPKMSGIECLKFIREIDKEVGVIMITAVKEEEIGKQALELGAFDYITKPLSLKYLEDCLMVKLLQMTA